MNSEIEEGWLLSQVSHVSGVMGGWSRKDRFSFLSRSVSHPKDVREMD